MEDFKFEQSNPAELRKNISGQQSAMYESALTGLMERSNDNPELVNALRDFVKTINMASLQGGDSSEPMSQEYVSRLTTFFREKDEELRRVALAK